MHRHSQQPTIPPNSQIWLIPALIIAPVVVGTILSLASPRYALIATGVFMTPLLFLLEADWIILAISLLSFIVLGLSSYFLHINLYWLPFLLGLALYLYIFYRRLTSATHWPVTTNHLGSWQMASLALFFASAVISTIVARPQSYQLLLSFRDYFFLWSIYWVIALGIVSSGFPFMLWRVIYWTALFQIPISFIQYAVFALHRTDQTRWDSVVGSFIGNEYGGGDSGGMAIFLFLSWTMCFYLVKHKIISFAHLLIVGGATLLFISLAEVKVALVLIMIFSFWIALARARVNVLTSMLALTVGAVLIAAIIAAYLHTAERSGADSAASTAMNIKSMLSYSIDPNNIAPNGDVGRMAALSLWWNNANLSTDPYHFLVGYGLGSTFSSPKGMGVVAAQFAPLHLAPSAMTVLLWDTGTVGLASFIAFVIFTFIRAIKLQGAFGLSPMEQAIASSIPPCLLYFLVSLPYNKDILMTSPAVQILFLAFCGMVSYFYRFTIYGDKARRPSLL